MDIDTVKGCSFGVSKYQKGCYGLCYAYRIATAKGYDFSKSVIRRPLTKGPIEKFIKKSNLQWFRTGVFGDPSYSWDNTCDVCDWLGRIITPVIVTKHWVKIGEEHIRALKKRNAIIHTSISALDTSYEIEHRLNLFAYLKDEKLSSILRIVSVKFGATEKSYQLIELQKTLFNNYPIIDTPLRIPSTDARVLSGDILITKHRNLGSWKNISILNDSAYIGPCKTCPDQCGVNYKKLWIRGFKMNKHSLDIIDCKPDKQIGLFDDNVEFEYVKSVIGSGYEEQVAKLAIEDKVAYRAARKNMQIHSAIILKINGKFSGFFTFQVNHDAKEFCLLQSAMDLTKKDKKIYSEMVNEIIKRNTYGYPMIMTVSTKHDLECPAVFEAIGFKTYLNLSGFEYMVYGSLDDVRMKRLAHATMTNAWTTTRSDWLLMKREWNEKIEAAGEKYGIKNPKYATRDGSWQGKNGYSNVVLTERIIENGEIKVKKDKSLNGNSSVLDPVACETILRFFMPTEGTRVYNPFGGGVQFGFVSGSYGYEYVASEIRQNQCDANNALCQEFPKVKWIKSDSSIYKPEGKFDLCFSCPPYYRVEKYIDYDGVIPEGELNNLKTYEEFRDTLFMGYRIAIEKLNDDRFFVVMTGDSRDKNGAYYGCEAEHELFFKNMGLKIYNKIIYLECEFTRLAHAKKTLDYRKFPKREQKIIVAYKGDTANIKKLFPPIGRL